MKPPSFQSTTRENTSDEPPAKAGRFYYGWVIAVSMAIIGGWTLSMGVANFGFFINPMREELDFDRSVFGWASSARTIGAAVGGILIGRLIDQHGPRVLLAVFGGIAAVSIALISMISQEWHLIAIYGIVGMLGMQGGANIYTGSVVAKWFVVKRTKAMSVMYLGLPMVLIFAFPLTQFLIDEFGWRTAWLVIGLVGVGLIVPISLLLLRRQPEDMGLQVDGLHQDGDDNQGGINSKTIERSWTRAEALRSGTFWRLTLAFGLHMAGQQSVSLYRWAHYADQGVDPTVISYAASMEGVSSIVAVFTLGFLVYRFRLQGLASIGFILMIASHSLTIVASTGIEVTIATILFGLAVTYLVMVQSLIYPAFFGRAHIGAIRGVSLSISMGLGAASAPLTGYVADSIGTFAPVWWVAVSLLAVSAVVIGRTKAPGT